MGGNVAKKNIMSELTNKQARIIRRQINKLYGRNYIPLITTDSTLTIGDILSSENDTIPIIDSSIFSANLTKFVEGPTVSKNITSSSEVNITTKLKGEAVLSEHFKIDEAGIVVDFSSNNQMFLKVQGMRQQSMVNFIEFRDEILNKYTKGDISANVYIVRGLVYADKYYLQFSGTNGGTVSFNLNAEIQAAEIEASADFKLKWKKEVGYNIDGSNGGVLAYRVSGIRLKRHLITEEMHLKILDGIREQDILANLSFDERKKLLDKDMLELVDVTDEVIERIS